MIIDGKSIAQEILDGLKPEVAKLPFKPVFCDILVGDDPVAASYVAIKGKRAEEIGMEFWLKQLTSDVTTENLISTIQDLQKESRLCGLIIQLPLPAHIHKQAVIDVIDPKLDVDCIGTENSREFYEGRARLVPPTAAAIMHLLQTLTTDLKEKKFLVIGQGQLVGMPVTHLLKAYGFRVMTADKETSDLSILSGVADVIISGTGKPGLITTDLIKDGAIIIDAGTAESDGGIAGDVDFESVKNKASFISPVPGGVGPVTVAKLLENVLSVAKEKSL